MKVHTTRVPRPDSGQTSAVEPGTQESAQTTVAPPSPSSTSSQRPNQTNQQPHVYATLQSHEVEPSARVVSSEARNSQNTFRHGNRVRRITPTPHQEQIASHLQPRTGEGISSVDFPTSTFSFRAPDRMSHPVYRAPQNEHGPRPIHAGYHSTQPSVQASAQVNRVPARPSTWYSRVLKCMFLTEFREVNPGQFVIFRELEEVRRDSPGN